MEAIISFIEEKIAGDFRVGGGLWKLEDGGDNLFD